MLTSEEIREKIDELTIGCSYIGKGLDTFAFDLDKYPRELTWKDLNFVRDQAGDLMMLYYKISEIIEAQDNLRRQNLTNTEK